MIKMQKNVNEQIMLGNTGILLSPLGMGLMQWGDIELPEESDPSKDVEVIQMFRSALASGISFYDTAEVYGNGKSERHLQNCLEKNTDNLVIATKFMPFPWRLAKRELRSALKNSMKRIGVERIDLYQMHWPFPPVPISKWMEAMSESVESGLIRSVGVSNYSPAQTQIAFDALAKYHIPLASNQVKFNLLDRHPDKSGLVDLCQKLGVTIIAYSPLEKGVLTGKYSHEKLPRGLLAWRYNKSFMSKIEPLFSAMREIGEAHGGKSLAMIALNWLICRGIVPIPGARNVNQASENAGALGWQLNNDEVNRLDELSLDLS